MTEEQRPLEGPDEQDPQQLTAPVDLERTMPLVSYPPPTGSPFVHQPPPVEPASAVASGGDPSMPWPPVSDASVAPPAPPAPPAAESSVRRGLGAPGPSPQSWLAPWP